MATELGQISIYLAKEGKNFNDLINKDNLRPDGDNFKIREFKIEDVGFKFFCDQTTIRNTENPLWLNFINENIPDAKNQIHFDTYSRRPSGLLLASIEGRVLAATFGVRGGVLLEKENLLPDFGIRTAMNMCGNKELRQTKSRTHSLNTKHINRQLSKPSDAFSFGLNETEFLQYISAHLEGDEKVTLQGKDNLTIKIIGEDKLSWEKLINYGKKFIEEYRNDKYKQLFPNYPNLQDVTKEEAEELDDALVQKLVSQDHERMHLAIPEFIAEDEFSFTYNNYEERENKVFSNLDISQLKSEKILNFDKISIEKLKNKNVYAFSHEENRILESKKWKLYACFVAEVELRGNYFILSDGVWKKVDDEFYRSVTEFVENVLIENAISERYHNIDISDNEKQQNREEIFNKKYCELNKDALLFDKSKLRIGQSDKNNEFCDILEYSNIAPMDIIHVKKYGGSSSINYLFSQARFYCEYFMSDKIFLSEIRAHIDSSVHPRKNDFLSYIKDELSDLTGKDYAVRLWILYDARGDAPRKDDLPLMAKYELKLTYEILKNVNKYSDVSLSMIPVSLTKYITAKTKK